MSNYSNVKALDLVNIAIPQPVIVTSLSGKKYDIYFSNSGIAGCNINHIEVYIHGEEWYNHNAIGSKCIGIGDTAAEQSANMQKYGKEIADAYEATAPPNGETGETGTGGNNTMTTLKINTIKNLKGTVEISPQTGPLWHLILPDGSTRTVQYGPLGSMPCTYIGKDGNEQIAVYYKNGWGNADYALDEAYSFGYADIYVAEEDVGVISQEKNMTVQIEYPKTMGMALPIAIAVGIGLGVVLLKKKR